VTLTLRPDLRELDVPMDALTEPFWEATAMGELRLPRCGRCGRFRWPPGPFCPRCNSQEVDWMPAGAANIYSYTIVPAGPDKQARVAPALIEFADAPGVRLPAAIVDSPIDSIRIGAPVTLDFSPARNAEMPVFRITAR
jgi:uncharacterized OB-fold protein